MRLFLHEYTCGSSLRDHPELAALRGEGRAMLAAVLRDASRVRGVEATTLLERDCGLTLPQDAAVRWLEGDEEVAFKQEAAKADATLVVAPESDGILAERCRWIESAGGRSLNCSPAAIELAGDKLAQAVAWLAQGLPTPRPVLWPATPSRYPAVWKPRHGAGSQATFVVRDAAELAGVPDLARVEGYTGPAIVQPWVPGRPASVAWLIGPKQRVPLAPTRQILSTDGRCHYLGGELPLPPELAARAIRLSERAVTAPGLLGYVGVDLVLGDADDGSADQLIELNPRVTTSYLGLRQLAGFNLIEALLDAIAGRPVEPHWRPGPIRFRS